MEMEDEKNTEKNSATGDALTEDENLGAEQYEITVGDVDSGDFDFDLVDDEDQDGEAQNDDGQFASEITENDLDVLDFDLVDNGE